MTYKVIYWDDRNDYAVKEVYVHASNFEEAEEEAARVAPDYADRYPVSDIIQLSEEEISERQIAQAKAELKKELEEFGIETYLHENLKSITAQLVLSKFCSETMDILSEEDRDALTSRVIEAVLEDM